MVGRVGKEEIVVETELEDSFLVICVGDCVSIFHYFECLGEEPSWYEEVHVLSDV